MRFITFFYINVANKTGQHTTCLTLQVEGKGKALSGKMEVSKKTSAVKSFGHVQVSQASLTFGQLSQLLTLQSPAHPRLRAI